MAVGPAGLGNRPLLEALEVALPDGAVEEVIERTETREQRRRLLPTHLVVPLVVGIGLWAEEAVRHVLAATSHERCKRPPPPGAPPIMAPVSIRILSA